MRKPRASVPSAPLTGRLAVLTSFSGVPLKVSALNGVCLFTARVISIADGSAYLSYLYGPENTDLKPWDGPLFEAELRGYSKLKHRAIRVRGLMRHVTGAVWSLARITFVDSTDERRDNRLETDFEGSVTFLDRRGILSPCHVSDLSMGGACLVMNRPSAVGERIRLQAGPFVEAGIESLFCQVCYNRFDEEDNLLCGCKFEDLEEETRKNPARMMIKLQMRNRRMK